MTLAARWPWLLLALLGVLSGCQDSQPQLLELNGQTMGTSWSVKLVIGPQQAKPATLADDIRAALQGVNDEMSTYQADSALSRFNRNPSTDWQSVPKGLAEVVQQAQQISALSDGEYDVTIGPLVNLWGFGPGGRRQHPPAQEEIDAARAQVGFDQLQARTEAPALKKSIADLYVDLSSIAKGYGVDRVADLIERNGYPDYLVEIGGELRAGGHNVQGKRWQIAVEKPDEAGREVQQVIPLSQAAIATSGDYRNFFVDNGRRYSHTIDPASGQPIKHSLASVSVLAKTCMLADGLATAFMALGPQRGLLLAQQQDIAALFILRTDTGFKVEASSAFLHFSEGKSS